MSVALSRELGRLSRSGILPALRRDDFARWWAFGEACLRAESESDLSPEDRALLARIRARFHDPIRRRLRLRRGDTP